MSNSYQLSGTVKVIEDTQTFASGFQKREFVVTVPDGQYPQDVKLEFMKDSCVKLDSVKPGDPVEVEFNIRGNEYNGKYYVNLQAWKMTKTGEGKPLSNPDPDPGQAYRYKAGLSPSDDDEDVPF